MRVRSIETFLLEVGLESPIRTSFGTMAARRSLLVEIIGDDGLIGLGEAWCNFPDWAPVEKLALLKLVASRIVGTDISDIPQTWDRLVAEFQILCIQWGALGLLYQVVSALDVALWDLAARGAGVPLYRFLGGVPIDELPVYASGLGPSGVRAQARSAAGAGHVSFKLKVGFGSETDVANLELLRGSIGDEGGLMVDANQRWTVDEAIAMADNIRSYRVLWLEEPVRGDEIEAICQVRRQCGIPVAAGENLHGPGLRRLIEAGGVDVVQPDVSKTSGISESLRIGSQAAEASLAIRPHYLGGVVGFVASMHLAAAGPDPLLEMDVNPNPLRDQLVDVDLSVARGKVRMPTGPGLGIHLERSMLDRYQTK